MNSVRTPEQLGITVEHIAATMRKPMLFSEIVHELAGEPPLMDLVTARECRDTLIDGKNLVNFMIVACQMDEAEAIERITEPNFAILAN